MRGLQFVYLGKAGSAGVKESDALGFVTFPNLAAQLLQPDVLVLTKTMSVSRSGLRKIET
jgi:hypothetical protein